MRQLRLSGPVAGCLLIWLAGCHQAPPAEPVVASVSPPKEPGQIEVSSARARFEPPNIVWFDVPYRFTHGQPNKYYLCEFSFPGTDCAGGLKPMEAFELKQQGAIRDGIEIKCPDVAEFSVTIAEADSPDRGYKVISNTFTGKIER